jgi:hypothetical protein
MTTHQTAIAEFANCFDMTDGAIACAMRCTPDAVLGIVLETGTSATEGAPVWLVIVTRRPAGYSLPAAFVLVSAAFRDDDADVPVCHAIVSTDRYHEAADAFKVACQ